MSFETSEKKPSPCVTIDSIDLKSYKGNFLVGTGAELNLVKQNSLNNNVLVNLEINYDLFGIVEQGVTTLGEVRLNVNDVLCPFQVVLSDFPLEGDGMLGMPFLADSVIDLKTKTVKHKLGEFPFINPPQKISKVFVKARTKKIISLPVTNAKLQEGYLPLLPAGPGVFLGETLVTVASGNINHPCYNCTARDIEFSISPVTLQEFEIYKPAVDPKKTKEINKEIKGKSKRNIKKSRQTIVLKD